MVVKPSRWGAWICMENSTHVQGHSRACKGWKTMPRTELLKHLDSSERWWWWVTVPWKPPRDSGQGKGLLGGSQIHWASAVWQRFRSALLNAMWHVHQNKKTNKQVSKCKNPLAFTHALNIYQQPLTTLLSVHPAICLSSEHSFISSQQQALPGGRGGRHLQMQPFSATEDETSTISPWWADTDSKISLICNLEIVSMIYQPSQTMALKNTFWANEDMKNIT